VRPAYFGRLLEVLSRFQSSGGAEYTIENFAASMAARPAPQRLMNRAPTFDFR